MLLLLLHAAAIVALVLLCCAAAEPLLFAVAAPALLCSLSGFFLFLALALFGERNGELQLQHAQHFGHFGHFFWTLLDSPTVSKVSKNVQSVLKVQRV
jgi:hypothetical protein